jgi:hypothetical protein
MGMGPGFGGPPGGAAIAVSGDAVFVVQGPRIMKFSASDLELLAEKELPRPAPPNPPGE